MATAAQQLQARVEDVFGAHDLTWEWRDNIRDGVARAGYLGQITWDDLDDATKKLITDAEALPRTSWDDPSEVPDDTPDDF